jgi:hypothetical protein
MWKNACAVVACRKRRRIVIIMADIASKEALGLVLSTAANDDRVVVVV